MLQVYSINVDVDAGSSIPLNNVKVQKGCTVTTAGASSIALNKCGIYAVTVDTSSAAAATIQMYVNDTLDRAAQSTGTNAGFTTLVAVAETNTKCPCTSPTIIQFVSEDAATFTNVNVVVTKLV